MTHREQQIAELQAAELEVLTVDVLPPRTPTQQPVPIQPQEVGEHEKELSILVMELELKLRDAASEKAIEQHQLSRNKETLAKARKEHKTELNDKTRLYQRKLDEVERRYKEAIAKEMATQKHVDELTKLESEARIDFENAKKTVEQLRAQLNERKLGSSGVPTEIRMLEDQLTRAREELIKMEHCTADRVENLQKQLKQEQAVVAQMSYEEQQLRDDLKAQAKQLRDVREDKNVAELALGSSARQSRTHLKEASPDQNTRRIGGAAAAGSLSLAHKPGQSDVYQADRRKKPLDVNDKKSSNSDWGDWASSMRSSSTTNPRTDVGKPVSAADNLRGKEKLPVRTHSPSKADNLRGKEKLPVRGSGSNMSSKVDNRMAPLSKHAKQENLSSFKRTATDENAPSRGQNGPVRGTSSSKAAAEPPAEKKGNLDDMIRDQLTRRKSMSLSIGSRKKLGGRN